ncbi:hypothetical protein BOW15_10425 [Solemya velum gill symbiont]|nr:hypothetical protein BOW15_10425 [Solemya velum gill symbiont]
MVVAAPSKLNLSETVQKSVSSPLPPEYVIEPDGAITLRVCFNWSCKRRQAITFTADDMVLVKERMATCSSATLHDRLQQVRIGIWQLELLAQKYQPLLTNDLAINDFEADVQGRMDCVDNISNTSTYLHILRDIGALEGWSVSSPKVRNRFDLTAVHWTAVLIDTESEDAWSIDSWFRPNGHLPMVMPLRSWSREKKGWESPYAQLNPTPYSVYELCTSAGPETLTLQE